MMFYLLCAALCLSVLFLVTAGAHVVRIPVQCVLRPALRRLDPRSAANLVFGIHILPFFIALVVALAFAAPAFLEFEPRSTNEGMSWKLLLLSLAGTLLVSLLAARATRSLWATDRLERQWRRRARAIRVEGFDLPIYCVEGTFPFLAVTGLLRPRIFVGRAIAEQLSANELRAALEHEMAHVRSFDNLKQLLLKSTRLWSNSLGDVATWVHASEAAADEEALAEGASALDLSAALVKMGRMNRQPIAPASVLASQFLPDHAASSLSMRVQRLEKWLQDPPTAKTTKAPNRASLLGLAFLLTATFAYGACIHTLLPRVHEMLEVLVR